GLLNRVPLALLRLERRPGSPLFTAFDAARLEEVGRLLAYVREAFTLNDGVIDIARQLHRQVQNQPEPVGDRLVAESRAFRQVVELARQLSVLPVEVFIHGESGSGKEVVARLIHGQRERRSAPFVAVNCAAIPENLMESEFFGHEKGAFSGAVSGRMGRFEEATGGTLFLDEVGELPLAMQAKFLRAIQEKEGTRLGSGTLRRYDFRLLSASATHLRDLVALGRFREDLYYRLFAVDVRVPPLRERPEDIAPLARLFLESAMVRFGKRCGGFQPATLAALLDHSWPGNVRQLRHEVERLLALVEEGESIPPQRLSFAAKAESVAAPLPRDGESLDLASARARLEQRLIRQALHETGGNKVKAARLLGITRQALHLKLREAAPAR
ncbi:MAG: sigma-54-dependent Fis family transcriptional regulator, partial [Magnetococcales bacterium]|nr:sigma-54-dependent Fis family transcriptional regulator [Magnetococcales bacterium]